jgi:uncharacterized protein (DUF1778 family)
LVYAGEKNPYSKEHPMSRLSIDITPEQHQRLKALAALAGQTIKDYILQRTLPPLPEHQALSEEEALRQLEAFLKPRLEEAERGERAGTSVEQIFADARHELRP